MKKLMNKINGLHYRQEYLCVARESFQQPIASYLVDNKKVLKDITDEHLFVGYHPLVFALAAASLAKNDPENIKIVFSQGSFHPNEIIERKDAIARLQLKKLHWLNPGREPIILYEGISGSHHFVSGFHQFIIGASNRLYNRKPGNVFLDDDLLKQVQIAYSIPRKISLVTVGSNELFNHFPTDLHGKLAGDYIISLRHAGKACQEVESAGRIVLSDVHVSSYQQVYALGKNHMQALQPRSSFNFSPQTSKNFNLPLPPGVLSYKELQLEESFTHGIHKLLRFRIVDDIRISEEPATLAHIHNCYATWRYNHRISSNLFLR